MPKTYTTEKINDLLSLTKVEHTYTDSKEVVKSGGDHGHWLHCKHFGMNLSMRAEDEKAALVGALKYYQKRLIELETQHNALAEKVNIFVSQFTAEEEE